jgi:hypothetical protein
MGSPYMTDCRKEFPASWFANARLSSSGRDCSLNYFGVDASEPLSVWRKKGWIHPDDPRGWFSAIADITWGDAYRLRTHARLSAGKRSNDMSRRLGGIASPAILRIGHGSVRLCSAGLTTAARLEPLTNTIYEYMAVIALDCSPGGGPSKAARAPCLRARESWWTRAEAAMTSPPRYNLRAKPAQSVARRDGGCR